ncbi:hypothetical protein GCM10018775_05340 [Streptomyces umbrinus]|nr:hypothetical protein GCM10018775_05340 [Streptomyces umbrinus]
MSAPEECAASAPEASATPAASAVPGSVTGIRNSTPQGHPSSGRGQWSARPQDSQRIVTQPSSQVWCVTGSGSVLRSRTGATGAPHTHGYDGAA